MNKIERVKIIMKTLNKLYPKTPIPLKHKNNFELLIAVLLSAQCTDERVNMVSPKLFLKANNPRKMLSLSERQIYNIVRPCGLAPQKSKAIYNLSRILIKEFNGKVPQNYEDLEKLPGVGHKTASVVMSQGFGYPAFPVDTHIHRLAQRWKLTNGKNVKQTEKDLKRLFPETSWNKLHLQIIYYGREFCTARNCFGLECEICSTCFPTRKKSIKTIKA
ncbi:MAG: endonuclease III [Pelagibacteraceae bacterium]|jgi:endonuclease-3|nr:endonuclease III [Pelagibacteraceae bacterium]|tara:strand:- start:5758 stop:6411 length:654 start_codon:yes stop_codon:yes gene_type:complete